MALIDKFIDFRKKLSLPFAGFNAGDTAPDELLPTAPQWFFKSTYGQPRGVNIYELRQFAASPWAQMVTSTFRRRFFTTPLKVVNVDPEDKNDYVEERKILMDFARRVNSNNETLIDSLLPVVTDVAEIDAGAQIKVFSEDSYETQNVDLVDPYGKIVDTRPMRVLKPLGQRTLVELWYADGSTILKQFDVYRRLQGYFQYSWIHNNPKPVFFERDQVAYYAINGTSYRGYGFSPLQTVQQVVELLINATRWNKEFYKNNAMPAAVVSLMGGLSPEQVKVVQNQWEREFKGKSHKLLFQNSPVDVKPLQIGAREMEWLEGQAWYMHLVFGAYGVSPVEVGYHEKVNVGNQEGQERVTSRNGIEPYFRAFEQRLYADIVPELLQMENPPVKYVFDYTDDAKSKEQHRRNMEKLDHNVMTVNEVRALEGLDPVEWGVEPQSERQAKMSLQAQQQDVPDPKVEPAQSRQTKSLGTEPSVVEESEDYEEFFQKQVDKWESAAVSAIEKVDLDVTNKTFGEFLQQLANSINSSPFFNRVRKFVKESMKEGLAAAEEELGVQVGAGKRFNARVEALANQQLNGYLINGKMWHGIRGATTELRMDVLQAVEDGVRNKKSRSEIIADVRKIFRGSSMSQASTIARTETTRFINEGKLSGYVDSGIKGRKAWSVVPSNCCEECHEMEKRYGEKGIPFDDDFVTRDGTHMPYPPIHPNCRCVIEYRAE